MALGKQGRTAAPEGRRKGGTEQHGAVRVAACLRHARDCTGVFSGTLLGQLTDLPLQGVFLLLELLQGFGLPRFDTSRDNAPHFLQFLVTERPPTALVQHLRPAH